MSRFQKFALCLIAIMAFTAGCAPAFQERRPAQVSGSRQVDVSLPRTNAEAAISPHSPGTVKVPPEIPVPPKPIEHGVRQTNLVALTFDADMTPFMVRQLKAGKVKSWYNQDVVRVLEENHVPATFFITGMWAELYPEAVREIAANGLFETGNHTYSHPAFEPNSYGLPVAKEKDKPWQIAHTTDVLAGLSGRRPVLFRFPGGIYTSGDLKLVAAQGLTPVQWDVVSGDAFNPDPSGIVKNVIKNARGGSIIVMHLNGGPNAPATAKALPAVINGLKAKGFKFVTVSTLLGK